MTIFLTRRPLATAVTRVALILGGVLIFLVVVVSARSAQAPVGLGTAGSFAVLAGSTITNTGPTTITGDVGLQPGTAVTGFASVTLNGTLHVADAAATQAKEDLIVAYNDAAGRGPATAIVTELGGQTLTAGVYESASGTFGLTGTLTLDGQGVPSSVFIFQTATTLITATNSVVQLTNGASACNVFWQVGSSATIAGGSTFKGTILALSAITLVTGATIDGRALARNAAVTMDTNTITAGACATPTPTPTPTPVVSPTPAPTPTLPPTDAAGRNPGGAAGSAGLASAVLLVTFLSLLVVASLAIRRRRQTS